MGTTGGQGGDLRSDEVQFFGWRSGCKASARL